MAAYYNDVDPYCCRVLEARIADGRLPPGVVDPRDVRDLRPEDLEGYGQVHLFAGIGGFPLGLRMAGVPDDFPVWTAGFPCQDLSFAGRGAGLDGARSGLWSEIVRLAGDLRPRHLLLENVAALLVRGLDRVLGDLAAIGYDAEWHCLPAAAVGAPHLRDRVFILAHPGRQRRAQRPQRHREPQGPRLPPPPGGDPVGRDPALADADGAEWGADDGGDEGRTGTRGEAAEPTPQGSREDVPDAQGQGRLPERRHQGGSEQPPPIAAAPIREDDMVQPGGQRPQGAPDTLAGQAEARLRRRPPHPPPPPLLLGPDAPRLLRHFRDTVGRDQWREDPALDPQSGLGRVAHGIPHRVDRLRGLGNAVVPQLVHFLATRLLELHHPRARP